MIDFLTDLFSQDTYMLVRTGLFCDNGYYWKISEFYNKVEILIVDSLCAVCYNYLK